MRSALLEGAHSSLQKSVSDLSARNAMLEGALQQANAAGERLSSEHNTAHNENRELRRTIENLRSEMEESIRVREGFRGKFNKLQEDMRTASAEIGKEQARWARRDEEQKARIEVLEARLAAEAKSKENLEREIERLRSEEREAIRLKVELEHVRRHADKMEALSDKIRGENIEHHRRIAILQVDVETSRQAAHAEVSRATATLQREVEAARNEVDRVTQDAEVAKAKHALLLDEMAETQKVTIQATKEEALQNQAIAIQEQHQKYEHQLEELRGQNERSIALARQDAEREQAFLRQNLNMARNQSEHLREKIAHLEDRLGVATSAAQAAAKAAREAKANPGRAEARGSNTEERVSPQALRESIVALQEQLGEREARVEELEQKLLDVEKETTKKIKDSDFEIGWLRELLSERISELEEISSALQSPTYSREVVREAAVRLKTNLQMEQQVRERQTNGNPELSQSLASVAGGLAKQIPLAWGSWRKTKAQEENTHVQPSPSIAPSRPAATPQTSGFLSGFLTPPTMASARSRISGFGGAEQVTAKRPRPPLDMSGYAAAPGSATSSGPVRRQPPVTTPQYLTRRQSYDDDADVSVLGFYGEDEGDAAEFGADDDEPPFKHKTGPAGAYLSG
ncbi:hypothetical protein DFH27DRAFT_478665 [Peziza echinospora]|nr:hypothetical protein DFH27DRAFT_478665 [Peziza echinospora]